MLDYLEIVEQEFTYHRDGKLLFTGHPDRVRIYPAKSIAICSDWKYGFKPVQSADANMQLRCYISMIFEEHPVDNYYGAIFQPRISSRPHSVHYTREEVLKARAEIESLYDACFAENAPRRASNEACEYCEAKTICAEHIAWVGAVQTVGRLPVSSWSDAQMSIFEERRSAALKFIDDVHEQIKLIKLANPERLPGWRLKDGNEVRTVEDIVGAFGAMQSHLTAQEFSSACTMALGDIEELVWKKHKDNPALGKLSQKDARRLVDSILASFITKKRNKPSLLKDE